MKFLTKLAASILVFTFFFSSNVSAEEPRDTVTVNPIVWKTKYNKLSSSNFYIKIGDQYFYGSEDMNIHSDPGTSRTTLEMIWQENGQTMRLFMYFKRIDTNMWEMYDLRSYNKTGNDWIYYSPADSLGNKITSLLGMQNYADKRIFLPKDSSIDAQIYCKGCSITAFTSDLVPLSSYGYGIDFRIGLGREETITITTNPMTGYGVNALLLDSSQSPVLDQSNFEYHWSVANSKIASVNSQSIPYPDNKCAYDILPPCPEINAQIAGKSPGVTQIALEIKRKSDDTVIAKDSFDVKIITPPTPIPTFSPTATSSSQPISTPQPTPSPQSSPSGELSEIQEELSQLRGEVGEVQLKVDQQKEELSAIRRILDKIISVFRSLFR